MINTQQPPLSSTEDLSAFFRKLCGSLDAASKAHEAELRQFFAGLKPTVAIARRAQTNLDRAVAPRFHTSPTSTPENWISPV